MGNKNSVGNEGGRPEKYRKRYCKEIVEFFTREPNRREIKAQSTAYNKAGVKNFEKLEYEIVANPRPTLLKFATHIGVHYTTLLDWSEKKSEFSKAFKQAKELYKDFLIENGLAGAYSPGAFVFVAKTTTDLKDSSTLDVTSGGEKIKGFNYIIPPGADPLPDPTIQSNEWVDMDQDTGVVNIAKTNAAKKGKKKPSIK